MSVQINQDHDKKFKPLLSRIKERVLNLSRKGEKGIINKKSKSSVVLRDNGDINTSSSKYSQKKLNAEGKSTDISQEHVIITNTYNITLDEMIVNGHKFNNQLFEYTDLKAFNSNKDKLVGGLTLQTTVMTKSWEPTLGRYVMIRRPARHAMFSPITNIPNAPKGLSIDTDLLEEFKDMFDIEAAASKFEDMNANTKEG